MPEDSQLFLTEPDERVFAFVRRRVRSYLSARALVRPVPLCTRARLLASFF